MHGESCQSQGTNDIGKARGKESWMRPGSVEECGMCSLAADGGPASGRGGDCCAGGEAAADSEVDLAMDHNRLDFEGEEGDNTEMVGRGCLN